MFDHLSPKTQGVEPPTMYFVVFREIERDLTQSYDKSPYTDRKIQKATQKHKNASKNFDYSSIADRIRTESLGNKSNGSHPTCVVNCFAGSQPSP